MISRPPDTKPAPGMAGRGRRSLLTYRPPMATPPAPSESWARRLVCSRTGEILSLDQPAFLSAAGAPLLVEYDLDPERGERLRRALPGRPWTLWRYRELLPLADFDHRVDLGEGGTPLIRLRRLALQAPDIELYIKDE